ncbi:MAG: hypothetical protein AAF750_11065, partial [Planctomycetota bacterium]
GGCRGAVLWWGWGGGGGGGGGALFCGLGLAVAFNAVYLGVVVFGAVALAGLWAVGWAWWRERGVAVGVTREVAWVAVLGVLGSAGALWFLATFTAGGGSVHDEGAGMGWTAVGETLEAMLELYGGVWVSGLTLALGVVGLGCWWKRGLGLGVGVGRSVALMLGVLLVLSVLIPLRVRATSHGFIHARFFSAVGPWVWLGVTTAVWVMARALAGCWQSWRSGSAGGRGVEGVGGVMVVWVVGGAVLLGVAGVWSVGWKGIGWELALNYRVGAVVSALKEGGVRAGDRYAIEPAFADELLDFEELPELENRKRGDSELVESVDETAPGDGGSWFLVLEHLSNAGEVEAARERLAGLYGRWWGGAGLPVAVVEHVRVDRLGVYRMDGDGSVWFGAPVRVGRGWGLAWESVWPGEGG